MSNNHIRAHSLVECFGDVKSVDLVGLGHDWILRLNVAFRHDACAAVEPRTTRTQKESLESERAIDEGGKRERELELSGEPEEPEEPKVGETGLWDSYMS